MKPYTPEIEEKMKQHFRSLNEKDRRHYAWLEALKYWYWWKQYIRKLFECGINTVVRGIEELSIEDNLGTRIRKVWWWDRKRVDKNPWIITSFEKVIDGYTAWSPVDDGIKRTNLRPIEIKEKFKEENIEISVYIIKQIMEKKEMRQRKLYKGKTLKSVPWRNEQFENIKKIRESAESEGNPTISVDAKKKNY
jgi:hypothetical protein